MLALGSIDSFREINQSIKYREEVVVAELEHALLERELGPDELQVALAEEAVGGADVGGPDLEEVAVRVHGPAAVEPAGVDGDDEGVVEQVLDAPRRSGSSRGRGPAATPAPPTPRSPTSRSPSGRPWPPSAAARPARETCRRPAPPAAETWPRLTYVSPSPGSPGCVWAHWAESCTEALRPMEIAYRSRCDFVKYITKPN